MNSCKVDSTFKTPIIEGNIQAGSLIMRGRSLPEDAKLFYQPFKKWLEGFRTSGAPHFTISFELDYYYTATSKLLINILMKLKKVRTIKKATVEWRYDTDDLEMEETRLDFKNLVEELIVMSPIEL
ncbi:MAG: hypothetical protein ACI857_000256 [Arenicella sp.]|jgi:hypothetical protein